MAPLLSADLYFFLKSKKLIIYDYKGLHINTLIKLCQCVFLLDKQINIINPIIPQTINPSAMLKTE